MKHKFEIVWKEDLEVYHCIRCGFETLDADENSKCRYWYKIYTTECVLCGTGETYRERVYGEKPLNPEERYDFSQFVCGYHYI